MDSGRCNIQFFFKHMLQHNPEQERMPTINGYGVYCFWCFTSWTVTQLRNKHSAFPQPTWATESVERETLRTLMIQLSKAILNVSCCNIQNNTACGTFWQNIWDCSLIMEYFLFLAKMFENWFGNTVEATSVYHGCSPNATYCHLSMVSFLFSI